MKDRTIKIGNKPLRELTVEDLRQIVIIEGCCPVIMRNGKEIWDEPIVCDFNNTLFSDTIVIDYYSHRKSDNLKSCEFTFFFNFKDFSFHYERDYEKEDSDHQSKSKRVGLEVLRYLIRQGFDVPL